MLSDSQEELMAWVRGVSDAEVSFARPAPEPGDGASVSLYLIEMRGRSPLSPARVDRHQLELGYLVTASSSESSAANQLLVDLCFAAMEQPGMEVDLEPVDNRLWQALGVPPQPSFRVTMPLRRRRPAPDIRPVLKPLGIEHAAISTLTGYVLTPDQAAVPEARVELPDVGRAAMTNRVGAFRLDGVPQGKRPVRVVVKARGREVTRDIGAREARSPVVITINPTEAVNG
ncbi:MAG TPA: hypothetical protein VEX62_07460 [Candidatus Limnocylindrales bacterium]|nr:hypothetical protein [Candidatus Limnocylindrales bacterium]